MFLLPGCLLLLLAYGTAAQQLPPPPTDHAFANGVSPLMSALVLAPDSDKDSGLLYAGDIYGMKEI